MRGEGEGWGVSLTDVDLDSHRLSYMLTFATMLLSKDGRTT